MVNKFLATYLNDHLAGSQVGLELVEHIAELYKGEPEEGLALKLLEEITEDRKILEDLISRLQITQSQPRKAVAWFSEKLAELKLKIEDFNDGPFHRLELWEALSLGIEGKKLLWRSVGTALAGRPEIKDIDLRRLEEKSERERREIEPIRIGAARAAFEAASV